MFLFPEYIRSGIIRFSAECLSGLTWSTLSGDPIFDIDSSTSMPPFIPTENQKLNNHLVCPREDPIVLWLFNHHLQQDLATFSSYNALMILTGL